MKLRTASEDDSPKIEIVPLQDSNSNIDITVPCSVNSPNDSQRQSPTETKKHNQRLYRRMSFMRTPRRVENFLKPSPLRKSLFLQHGEDDSFFKQLPSDGKKVQEALAQMSQTDRVKTLNQIQRRLTLRHPNTTKNTTSSALHGNQPASFSLLKRRQSISPNSLRRKTLVRGDARSLLNYDERLSAMLEADEEFEDVTNLQEIVREELEMS